jgi:hypothetical protein
VKWFDRAAYLASDGEPDGDTFIGHVAPAPADPIADAIARAHGARAALRELDGRLPEQPLAVTVRRTPTGTVAEPSGLDVAAFAIGDRCVRARLSATLEDEGPLAAALAGTAPLPAEPHATPFVTVTVGDEPAATARHGHRRAWRDGAGPWLGLSRADGLAIVSTCHMIVDGYGHAWLAGTLSRSATSWGRCPLSQLPPPQVASVDTVPLPFAWRQLAQPAPRALPLAYALGRLLHRIAGRPDARASPRFQIPVAPGAPRDPLRRLRRVVPALAYVRFAAGTPEPFAAFAARTRVAIDREAAGTGIVSRILAAARVAPAPLGWKRRLVAADRPRWLDPVADLLGGRGCASRIRLAEPAPPLIAVSAAARRDGWVATMIDDGDSAAVTLCGDGDCEDLLEQLLALLPR